MDLFLLTFIGLIFLKMAAELVLGALNKKEVLAHADDVPKAFKDFIDLSRYKASINYTLDKNKFSQFSHIYEALILTILLTSGLLPWLFNYFSSFLGGSSLAQSATLILITLAISIPNIPEELYNQFVIEEKYGFNKSNFKLWISDKIKGLLLTIVIGTPIIWGLIAIYHTLGTTWWIWGFGFVFGFQLIMMLLYPKLILPLFNKLTPLEEGELKTRLMNLAQKTGFCAETIDIMDGSKRSGHSNAFFTGMGKFRHIVLFDTLIEQLSPEELEAVLAHEIGHYKKGHVPQMLALSATMTLGFFYLLNLLIQSPEFYSAFGFNIKQGIIPAFLLFSILAGTVTFWFTPIINRFMRKNEYEADAFASNAIGNIEPMISSLRKLSEKNLSNLTPHKLFSAFYYSHPTLLERETALRNI